VQPRDAIGNTEGSRTDRDTSPACARSSTARSRSFANGLRRGLSA